MDDRESERERDGKDRTLFVRNFPWTTTDEELLQMFRTAGKVVSTRTVSFKKPPYRPRGIAFVVMATAEEASAALEKLNNTELGGREIMVQLAEPLPPKFGKKCTHRQYKSRAAGACMVL
jgi:RNA recognition motif-containing protein